MNGHERIDKIRQLLKEGKTYQEIGDIIGITRQRVQQLVPKEIIKCAVCGRRVQRPTKTAGLCSKCFIKINIMPLQKVCFCGETAVNNGMCQNHYYYALRHFDSKRMEYHKKYNEKLREDRKMGRPYGSTTKPAIERATKMANQIADLEVSICCMYQHNELSDEQVADIKKFLVDSRVLAFRNLRKRKTKLSLTANDGPVSG